MAKPAFTEHPMFMLASRFANEAFVGAVRDMDISDRDINDVQAGKLVDDMTRFLLRAYDAKQAKSQAA